MTGRLVRVAANRGAPLHLRVDGEAVEAREGDSVLAVLLTRAGHLRRLESNGEPRAGFCLMGACQDCWVWFPGGPRGRACTTPVREGLEVLTRPPAGPPHG